MVALSHREGVSVCPWPVVSTWVILKVLKRLFESFSCFPLLDEEDYTSWIDSLVLYLSPWGSF